MRLNKLQWLALVILITSHFSLLLKQPDNAVLSGLIWILNGLFFLGLVKKEGST
jgi:hypothetical protein